MSLIIQRFQYTLLLFSGESVSMDSIKNCLKLLEKWEVLEVSSTHGLRLLALEPAYESLSGIEGLIEKFESYVCRAESEC